mmetsp:Transcript_24218/g.59288  ORF Transcript_24218/g.59288 Transcript_24218/m.59288 type:complete len:102 (-) Transcript_24218:62-367(-)
MSFTVVRGYNSFEDQKEVEGSDEVCKHVLESVNVAYMVKQPKQVQVRREMILKPLAQVPSAGSNRIYLTWKGLPRNLITWRRRNKSSQSNHPSKDWGLVCP